jgi:hypothetical protein
MGIMALFTGALALKTWRSLKLAGAESISESVTIAKALRRHLMLKPRVRVVLPRQSERKARLLSTAYTYASKRWPRAGNRHFPPQYSGGDPA